MMEINPLGSKVILVVDDEPNVLYFVKQLCRRAGLGVLTAQSGLEALKHVQEHGSTLGGIILDLYMPGMGGIEVLKSVRKHRPELPIIILSALTEKREECLRLGAEAFVEKPYSLEVLERALENMIERHRFDSAAAELVPGVIPSAKVMIVDDEKEFCELMMDSFRDVPNVDFEVKYALNSDEALRLSLEFEPDIAIVDIKMPHIWGDELIDLFKAGQGHCPKDFIIYTSTPAGEHITRARKHTYKFLTKPVDIDVIVDTLTKICIKHQLLKKK